MSRNTQILALRVRALGRYKQGASVEQIAEEMDISTNSVYRYLGASGVTFPPVAVMVWTPERVIDAIERFVAEVGRTPSQCDFTPTNARHSLYFFKRMERKERLGLPSAATVVNRFGSWNKALQAAGLPTRSQGMTAAQTAELRRLP